jgi:suppressor of ftsI
MLAPGSRRDVLVRGGAPGSYALKAIPFAQFPGANKVADGGPVGNQTLLTLRSAGRPERMRAPAGPLADPVDLRAMPVERERTIEFGEMIEPSGAPRFLLNGMSFDASRTDITMKLGSVERWTLINTTTEWHTFHMHTNDFQVTSVDGRQITYVDYQDNVALAPGSHTTILIHPTDFTGRFVIHCHVTLHEDDGMMATVAVVREPSATASRAAVVHDGGLAIGSSAYGAHRVPALGRSPFWCSPKALRRS